ncbi:MAG TPA: cysteine desulfurase [Thermoprotei archaeon]|nr:cysteine desulfurase [Thermoprotei archaeon]
MFNVYKIREDFPILNKEFNGRKIIYLDNAATSQKPIQVINAIKDFYTSINANVHRGFHYLSQEASKLYENAHEVVASFINCSWDEIIFVRNSTDGLNMLAFLLLINLFKKGDNIVISIAEHHSNILPWIMLKRIKGIEIRVVDITEKGVIDINMLSSLIDHRTRLISIIHVSNVLGTINNISEISKIAHENNVLIAVDGAQSVPHMPIDVKKLNIDFLVFSGHKMLGPTGIGVLYGRRELIEKWIPSFSGGGTVSKVDFQKNGFNIDWSRIPWRYEAGTPNIAGAIGLAEAIKYIKNIGIDNIAEYEKKLVKYMFNRMENELENVKTYCPKGKRIGVMSFNIENMSPHDVAKYLDKRGIAIRSGFHCAEPLHKRIRALNGTARASLYFYNTREEIDIFIDTLKDLVKAG